MITIIETLGMLETINWGRGTATKTMTPSPLSGLIEQTKDNHQLTADGEERRRGGLTPIQRNLTPFQIMKEN